MTDKSIQRKKTRPNDTHADTASTSSVQDSPDNAIELWSPGPATAWSLLFSPAFGAWIHAKNWEVMGDKENAKRSRFFFFYGTLVWILIALFLPDKYAQAGGIGLLFGWYFSMGRKQIKVVKEKYGTAYKKKGWLKPIGVATAIFIAYFTVALAAIMVGEQEHFSYTKEDVGREITGLWAIRGDNESVEVKLSGSIKHIKIGDKKVFAHLQKYDSNSDTLYVALEKHSNILMFTRLWNDEKTGFSLKLTASNGKTVTLDYIADLYVSD